MTDALPPHAIERLLRAAAEAEPGRDDALVLGRYRVIREVGRGGMGVVFEAHDVELDRRVALKRMTVTELDGDAARRLQREARAAARLDHPNIAAVLDVGADVIVMQFVDGIALDVAAARNVPEVVALVRDAARAVHVAHEHGIIHRDLKPQNLLVASGRVFVTDFGLAKDLRDLDGQTSTSGHVLGTPETMAPEQAQGRVHDVDARTDVWGLGATLYRALTGEPPFAAADVVTVLRRIAESEPRSPRALVPQLSRDLENVVLKCLEKSKDRRYASAAALADDLQRVLDGRPVEARAPSRMNRVLRFAGRHRPAFAIGAVLTTIVFGVAAMAWHERGRRAASDDALALSELVGGVLQDAALEQRLGDVARANERLDEGIAACRAFVATHDVAHARYLLGKLLRARGESEAALAELDAALALEPTLIEARLERGLARAARIDHGGEDAVDVAARDAALADLEASASSPRAKRVDRALALGERARLNGDTTRARAAFDEVLRVDPLCVDARLRLAQVELAAGDGDAAWHHAMSALDLRRGFGPAYLARSAAAASPAPADALEKAALQHALSAADQRVAGGDVSGDALHERGGIRLRLDDVQGALEDFSSALAADPRDAMAYGNRSLVHARRAAAATRDGDRDAAFSAWTAAIDDATAALTIEATLLGARNNRGVFHSERARVLRALERIEDADADDARAGADFDAAVLADPLFALARLNRAQWWRRAAERATAALRRSECIDALQRAQADLDAVLARRPDDAAALLERALCAELDGSAIEFTGAYGEVSAARARTRAAFDAAVAAARSDARPLGLRGLWRMRGGERDAGRADVEAALRLGPDAELGARLRAALEAE
jgi:tetratricopeptide (TPR) repeat protein/predicted Ser/Thr protein kinase